MTLGACGGALLYFVAGPLPVLSMVTTMGASYGMQLALVAANFSPEVARSTSTFVSCFVGHLTTHLALTMVERTYDQTTRGMPMAVKQEGDDFCTIISLKNIDLEDPANSNCS